MKSSFFFFNDTATTEIYTLSLHDALPIYLPSRPHDRLGETRLIERVLNRVGVEVGEVFRRSEEHTSELQSPCNLVCRLLLEKKKLVSLLVRTLDSLPIFDNISILNHGAHD